jgi:hypothetical protein
MYNEGIILKWKMSIFADDLWLVSSMPFNDNYPHAC